MYIAPGLLDRRLTFYRRQDNGGDGFARPTYVKTGTFWGRLDASSQRQNVAQSPQSHVDIRSNWSAMVAEYVEVDPYGLVKEEGHDTLFYIRGVIDLRQLQGQRLDLEVIDPSSYDTFTTYDAAEVMDGEHLIVLSNAFSSAFDDGFA